MLLIGSLMIFECQLRYILNSMNLHDVYMYLIVNIEIAAAFVRCIDLFLNYVLYMKFVRLVKKKKKFKNVIK